MMRYQGWVNQPLTAVLLSTVTAETVMTQPHTVKPATFATSPMICLTPPKKTKQQTNKQKTTTNKQTTHLYAVGRKGSQLIITQQLTPVRTAQSKFHAKKSTVDVMFFSQAKVQQQSKKTTSQLVGALSPVNHRGLHQG